MAADAYLKSNLSSVSKEEYKEMLRKKNNEEYMRKLKLSIEQAKNGQVIVKTMEELEAMVNG